MVGGAWESTEGPVGLSLSGEDNWWVIWFSFSGSLSNVVGVISSCGK